MAQRTQGKKNLYFTVNPTLKPLSGRVKAKKEHIRGMIALHVDLDPRAGEDLEKERTRALALIKGFKPAPSFIIDSGGGFQGFWVLPKEMPTNGSTSEAAPLEAYNQQIALLLAADPCHNIDRIMRLPGTLNIPDKKKLAKGRKLACARLVEWNGTQRLSRNVWRGWMAGARCDSGRLSKPVWTASCGPRPPVGG